MMIGGIYVSFCMYLGMVKFGLNYFSLCFSVGSGGDFKGSSSRISLINSFFFFYMIRDSEVRVLVWLV